MTEGKPAAVSDPLSAGQDGGGAGRGLRGADGRRGPKTPPYVELRCASAFSFLSAASQPEDLVQRAADLGYPALSLADADGVYAVPRFVKACKAAGIRPIVGATVTLDLAGPGSSCQLSAVSCQLDGPGSVAPAGRGRPSPPSPTANCQLPTANPRSRPSPSIDHRPSTIDPAPSRTADRGPQTVDGPSPSLLLLCRDAAGWQNLCELLTLAHRGRDKGEALASLDLLDRFHDGLVAIAGGLDGPIVAEARARGRAAARTLADRLAGTFGKGAFFLDLQRHGEAVQEHANRFLSDLGAGLGVPCIATNDVRYATPDRGRVLDVLTAIRTHSVLDEAGRALPANHRRFLDAPDGMAARFADRPDVLAATADLAASLGFRLDDTGYRFPRFPTPPGETEFSLLYDRVQAGVRDRYHPVTPRVMRQVAHELDLIQKLDLAGYFLLVWDITRFCRERGILAQGRGSAANSSVCYVLGITAVDPIAFDLLFERFLSEERGEWPDIDLDLPSGDDREAVIQYVYQRYGERSVGMTSAVITYQGRSAVREVGKVLGLDPGRIDRLARLIGHFEFWDSGDGVQARLADAGLDTADVRVARFVDVFGAIRHLPRHLSQHNGGLVIAGGRLDRTVPLEPARMPGRTCIQWDKDDIADLRIIKVDLLGLGMLAALDETIRLVRRHEGVTVDLARLPPQDEPVYDMLRRADTVGVFQIESRAQMATLPRMRPERFYDLVVEVALIRPGPIVGKMVHPYLARRAGRQAVTYDHPSLEPILGRTLGVPLFQEQLMRMAMAVADFTGGQAEELRRAMGSRRSTRKMELLMTQLREGMTRKGIDAAAQDRIVESIASFALYGFPESHSASFALIAYASAWLKYHHPAAFYAALMNQWPMGFYHPATLVGDAARHGVEVRPVDVGLSGWDCTIEDGPGPAVCSPRSAVCAPGSPADAPGSPADVPGFHCQLPTANCQLSIRLGLKYVKGLSKGTGERILAARHDGAFLGVTDLGRRCGATSAELMTLAESGALAGLGRDRRDAMWQALALSQARELLAGAVPETPDEALPPMSPHEEARADFRGTGLTTGPHPMTFLRGDLARRGVLRACDLATVPDGRWVRVAGLVIVRQRPGTAKGFYFATLEDETGFANLAVTPDRFGEHRALLSTVAFLLAEGPIQNRDGVISVKGMRFAPLNGGMDHRGRNFC